MDYASILLDTRGVKCISIKGNVTTTIPELVVSPNKFGIHLTTIDGDDFVETVMKILFKVFQKR
jgi:glutaminase